MMKWTAMVSLALLAAGCVTFHSQAISSIPFDPETMDRKDVTEALSQATLFGVPVTGGDYSLQALIWKAKKDFRVDTVINSAVEEESSLVLGFIGTRTLRLTGIGIVFRPKPPQIYSDPGSK